MTKAELIALASSASSRWAVLIWPDWYDDPDDTGYYWVGDAASEAEAVAHACANCDIDAGHTDDDPHLAGVYEPTDPETVKVIEAGPDYRHLYETLKAAVLA